VDGRDRPLQIEKSIEIIAHAINWSFIFYFESSSLCGNNSKIIQVKLFSLLFSIPGAIRFIEIGTVKQT